eukprot:gb/GECG01009281.1/.p1 GENE.gb/GECG01009281.1/~~gb/GECG01009281.1/.p1  ORF type:complete len:110 (+),score=5.17 gb/GECG01009281.1/:1-330(+)
MDHPEFVVRGSCSESLSILNGAFHCRGCIMNWMIIRVRSRFWSTVAESSIDLVLKRGSAYHQERPDEHRGERHRFHLFPATTDSGASKFFPCPLDGLDEPYASLLREGE